MPASRRRAGRSSRPAPPGGRRPDVNGFVTNLVASTLAQATLTSAEAQAILAERGERATRRGNHSDLIPSGPPLRGTCGNADVGIERQRQRRPPPPPPAPVAGVRAESLQRRTPPGPAPRRPAPSKGWSADEAVERGERSPERGESRLARLQARLDDHLETVIAEADPQKAKPLLRPLVDEPRVRQPCRDPADPPARHAGGLRRCPEKWAVLGSNQ